MKKIEDNASINKGQFSLEPPEREAEFEKKRSFGVENFYLENRKQWREYPIKFYVADYPLHVDIELSTICNLKCPMCYTNTEKFKTNVHSGYMQEKLFKKLIDECAEGNVFSIRLSLRGESLIHPKVIDFIDYAKKKGIKEVSTLTNGLQLNEDKFKKMMDAGIDWITISFDGLGRTYEKIRYPAKYDHAIKKISNYSKLKQDVNRIKPVIKIQTILPAIQENPKAFYDIFFPITDMVSVNPLIDYLSLDDQKKILYEKNFSCPQIYQRLVVGSDGLVLMCTNDLFGEQIIGDANKQTIQSIWKSPKLEKARLSNKYHRGGTDYNICAKCYLPRKTEKDYIKIGNRVVSIENYLNRSQIIGT